MDDLATRFPRDMEYLDLARHDAARSREGINEIVHTLIEAVVLVIIVVFVFLQNWRATLIPLMTVPVSLIGAFIFFPMLGFSINVLSLLGLVLAIGIVVDDAIVVVEAVMHHIEHGMAPKEATLKAMEEVSGPVVAIGLILAAVFVPVGFMGGITGRLYQQFAITIALSVVLSVINALTLSPALAAMLLKPAGGKKSFLQPFYNWFNKVFGWTTDRYVGMAGILARKMFRSLAFIGILCYVIVMLVQRIPAGFVPEEDQGYILVERAASGRGVARAHGCRDEEDRSGSCEATRRLKGSTRSAATRCSRAPTRRTWAFFFVQLKPWHDRAPKKHHANGVVRALNQAFARDSRRASSPPFGPPSIPGLGHRRRIHDAAAGSQRQPARVPGATGREVHRGGAEAAGDRADQHAVPRVGAADLRRHRPQQGAQGGRADRGCEHDARGAARQLVYQRLQPLRPRVQGLHPGRAGVPARPEAARAASTCAATRAAWSRSTRWCRRADVGTGVHQSFQPVPIRRADRRARGRLLVGAGAGLRSKSTAREVLPAGHELRLGGHVFPGEARAGVAAVFMLAILLVFLILAAQYESWGLPFSVLLGTPFAVFGAYLGLYLARQFIGESYVNNVFAQIGLIMLIGLAAKNAILIVEFAKVEVEKGMPVYEAAMLAAKLRFRPILMTAFAFILGVVPLLTATGAGAEARKVIGMTVFAGMLVATILGVLLIPMLFVAVERVTGRKKAHATTPTAPPALAAGHEPGTH